MSEYVSHAQGGVVQTHKGGNARLQFFYLPIVLMVLVLGSGLFYQQVFRADLATAKENVQSQRRILVPGPRGNIYDREGRLLVGNRPRFAVVLYLDELRSEFYREYNAIEEAYLEAHEKDIPSTAQISEIARFTVVDRYLERINRALNRETNLDSRSLRNHFSAKRLLPYTLIDDLQPEEYAKLIEQLPVNSPLQVYTTSTRFYPYGKAAAHVLGYVGADLDIQIDEAFPGADLMTFKMAGAEGRNGLEAQFEEHLQGEPGGTIYRVDPSGYRVESLERRLPVQGKNLVTSIDIDLQLAAETRMRENEMAGAAVAMDIHTGEILVMSSLPDYDLNDFVPRLSQATAADINDRGAWLNRAMQGLYPPGSSFKILVAAAGLRHGLIDLDSETNCRGHYRVGNRLFECHDAHVHGKIGLIQAISQSCNIFFYEHGLEIGADTLAQEARRYGFGDITHIDLPHESNRSLVADPAWKKERRGQSWSAGDTANMSIGQGFLLVTPLQMADFTASVARGQTRTVPHMIHDPERPHQFTEPMGLSPARYAALIGGMAESTITGTSRRTFTEIKSMRIAGLRVAGKTGTAQKRTPEGTVNFAWFIAFAPIENPQIAIAVMFEGDVPGEETGGGTYSAPVAHEILAKWAEKHPELIPAPPAEVADAL